MNEEKSLWRERLAILGDQLGDLTLPQPRLALSILSQGRPAAAFYPSGRLNPDQPPDGLAGSG
jgi:hypothetical protein